MEETTSVAAPPCVPLLQGIRASKSGESSSAERYETSQQDSSNGLNAASNFSETSERIQTKYASFYVKLLSCFKFLEQANAKLLQLIRTNERPSSPPISIEKLLDDFSFKIATAKDMHERQAIEDGFVAGRQAFLAKRWKGRYHTLLDLTECYLNLLRIKSALEKEKPESNTKLGELIYLNEIIHILDGVIGPWTINKIGCETGESILLNDLSCGESCSGENRTYSEYVENDLVVPLSSVFLVDVLSNHRLCAQNIKQHVDVKPQLLHVFHKEKERRDQLKAQCSHLKNEIYALKKHYVAACRQMKSLECMKVDDSPTAVSNTEPPDLGEIEEYEEVEIEEDENPFDVTEVTKTMTELQRLSTDTKKLSSQIREIQSALKEEEMQLALIMKRLQRVTGTVHAFVRIFNDKSETCHIDKISHNKLLLDFKDCFIVDGINKAEDGIVELYSAFSGLVTECLHDGPITTITLGLDSEDLLLSPTEGLALLEVKHLISHARSIGDADLYLYAFAVACTDIAMLNLVAEHPEAETICYEHGDPGFIERSVSCVRIESADSFARFLKWLNSNKPSREGYQITVCIRLVRQVRKPKAILHASWLCFFPIITSCERDALADIFQSLRKRNRPNITENFLTKIQQKSLVGRSRTIIVLNIDFNNDKPVEIIQNLTFVNDAVKSTTEFADQLGVRSVVNV